MLKSFFKSSRKPVEGDFPTIFRAGSGFARELPAWSALYQSATPFPHIMLDGLFDLGTLREATAEIPSPLTRKDLFTKDVKHLQEHKYAWRDVPRMGERSLRLINHLNSKPFLEFLSALTGIKGLVSDPYLWGGGFHQITKGGKLAIHADFNIHPETQLYRRLNVLVYLNENWQEKWGGNLELWSPDMKHCAQRIAPHEGRMVVFNTTEHSYHGHPEPLACPADVVRKSLALYYYTYERPLLQPHSTLWQKRPEDDEAVAQAALAHKREHG